MDKKELLEKLERCDASEFRPLIFRSEEAKKWFFDHCELIKERKIPFDEWRTASFSDEELSIFGLNPVGYEIWKFKNFFLLRLLWSGVCFGTSSADFSNFSDEIRIVSVEKKDVWKSEKVVLQHWEDGQHRYIFYPLEKNPSKYLLGFEKKGAERWKKNEYRDYDCEYDARRYDIMFFEKQAEQEEKEKSEVQK